MPRIFKNIFILLLIFLLSIICGCEKAPNKDTSDISAESNEKSEPKPSYPIDADTVYLTFNDEFDGERLDSTKWNICPAWLREDCWWGRPYNSVVENGKLYLKVTGDSAPYDVGAIRTRGKFDQTFGYYEIRCKLPSVPGINAALWLMTDGANNAEFPGGADGTEIDVFETHKFYSDTIQHALHWDGYEEHHKTTYHEITIPNIYQGYHIFGFEWTKEAYRFYVDGKLTWETTGGDICLVPAYIKLTLGIGGWVGTVAPENVPTDGLVVDYIRVYQYK